MTDFGIANDSVAICKGVMLGIDPELRIVDLTHSVQPFSIADGARFLAGAAPYFPSGTVFVVVIDPGVGSSRKAIVVKSKRNQYFVLPDNGLITPIVDRDGIVAAREITNPEWMLATSGLSSTFHGRDIFSPAGAHLARGDNWEGAGPVITELVRLSEPQARMLDDQSGIAGEIIAYDDPFGNLITNVSGDMFKKLGYSPGDTVVVKLGSQALDIPFVRTFSDVPISKPLLFIDSRHRVSLAINQGDFSQVFKITPPVTFTIQAKPPDTKPKPNSNSKDDSHD
jgi:S-adenosyl-L-methionine hydrolase (adenosine-forming)